MRVQGRRGSVKAPSFIFKKNIKFLILGIDNISRLVYYIIKIRDKEKPKMTNYRIAEEIANEILNVRNARYEALKKRDFESYDKFLELEENLTHTLESFGYEASFESDGSPMLFREGRIAFKWLYVKNVSKIEEEN